MNSKIDLSLKRLHDCLNDLGSLSIAVSGGVDSMTLAFIAHRLAQDSEIEIDLFHALSPAVPQSATQRVERYAKQQGWNLTLINAKEMQDAQYLANPVNRCFFCKSNLYKTISQHTNLPIASGTNQDDLSDYRPGLIAAESYKVHHPYVESKIDKVQIRQLAHHFGLNDLQRLPASPCLSSRISTGIAIEPDLLVLIDKVERAVRSILEPQTTIDTVRCRIQDNTIAIQLRFAQKTCLDEWSKEIKLQVQTIIDSSMYADRFSAIRIEPYKMGSAFIQVSPLTVQEGVSTH